MVFYESIYPIKFSGTFVQHSLLVNTHSGSWTHRGLVKVIEWLQSFSFLSYVWYEIIYRYLMLSLSASFDPVMVLLFVQPN